MTPTIGQNDPWSPSAGTATQPNAYMKLLQRLRQLGVGQGQPGTGAPGVQTYNSLGKLGGQIAGSFLGPRVRSAAPPTGMLMNGDFYPIAPPPPVSGYDPSQSEGLTGGAFSQFAYGTRGSITSPTNSIVGEAGPERLSHPDGSQELIDQPQARVLNAGDRVTPLTPGPHKPTLAGKELLKRLGKGTKKLAYGTDDGADDDALTVGDLGGDAPPPILSPESNVPPPMSPQNLIAQATQTPNAQSMGAAPLTQADQIRQQLAALQTPVPKKPSIWQRLAAGGIGAAAGYANASGKRMMPIDPSAAQQGILYPGFGQQMARYNAQKQDLATRLALAQGPSQDAMQAANLAHLNAQTQLAQAQVANAPTAQLLNSPELVPDPDPQRQNPQKYPGLHVTVSGQPMYRPTPGEIEAQKKQADQEANELIPPVVAKELQLSPNMRVPASVAARYYAIYAESQKTKNPTNASLALAAAQGDKTAAAALEKLKPPPDPNVVANRELQNQLLTEKVSTEGQARSDKSYQYSTTELNKLGTPVTSLVGRLSRLQDSIAQNTPQADALIAPELLSVMAGGQGSGLRMNEAEISRIVGGRSNWETLKAAANKWQLDPKAALSITPAQRQQIRALVSTVADKITAQQQVLDQAYEDLNGTDDPKQHRQIVTKARKALTQAATSGGTSTQSSSVPRINTKADYDKLPSGSVYIDAQDGKQYRKK